MKERRAIDIISILYNLLTISRFYSCVRYIDTTGRHNQMSGFASK